MTTASLWSWLSRVSGGDGLEPDAFLSSSLQHTTVLLPAPLCIPCSLLLWQLLQGIFLVPIKNCHPQLPSLDCPLPALPAWAALLEPRLLQIEPGPSPQALLLLLEESQALECCCLVMPAEARHAQEAAQFLSVFSAGKFTGNEGSGESRKSSSSSLLTWREPCHPAHSCEQFFSSASSSAPDGPRESTFCFCRLQGIPSSLSLPCWDNLWLWATGRKWSGCPGCSCLSQVESGVFDGRQNNVWGHPPLLGPARARGEPEGLCLSASVGQRRGSPPVELHLLMVAVSHSPRMLRSSAMLCCGDCSS